MAKNGTEIPGYESMIETIRQRSRKFYRCTTCETIFNELGESNEHPCRPYTKINNKLTFNKGESDGLRATLEEPLKRSYSIERTSKGFTRVD